MERLTDRWGAAKQQAVDCAGCKGTDMNANQRPTTNADRIRAMSDEELAKIIVRAEYYDKFCAFVFADENPGFCDDDCNKCALNWLKQEVESDG